MRKERKSEIFGNGRRRFRQLTAEKGSADFARGSRKNINQRKEPRAGNQPVIRKHAEIYYNADKRKIQNRRIHLQGICGFFLRNRIDSERAERHPYKKIIQAERAENEHIACKSAQRGNAEKCDYKCFFDIGYAHLPACRYDGGKLSAENTLSIFELNYASIRIADFFFQFGHLFPVATGRFLPTFSGHIFPTLIQSRNRIIHTGSLSPGFVYNFPQNDCLNN